MQRTPRHCLSAVLVASLAAMPAVGDDFVWNQPDGGIFGDAENWNDGAGGVPDAADVALFDLFELSYLVQMTQSRDNDRLVIRRGSVTLRLTKPYFVYQLLGRTAGQSGIVVADEARQIAVARLLGGTFRASRVTVGQPLASFGSLDFGTDGTLEADVLLVGEAGTGFVSVSGASAQVGRVEVGASTSGYGDLTITSRLTVDDELVAGGAGLGIVNVLGATVEAASVTVGRDAGSTGRLTIESGTMNVAGNLEIAPAAGSWGRLVNDRGTVRVGGDLVIGREGFGELQLLTSDASLVVEGALTAPSPIGIVVRDPSPSPNTPLIEVTGRADLGGIVIGHVELPPPGLGDQYFLVRAASGLAGTPVTPSALPTGLAWVTTVTDTEVRARIGYDCNVSITDQCALMSDGCTPADVRSVLDAVGSAGDAFGAAVDVDGSYAVVGSPDATPPFVTVFVQRGTRWIRDVRLDADSGEPGDGFARSVGIGGSTIVVGAPAADGGAGAAYVFERGAGGVWTVVTRLTADGSTAGIDAFGVSVATNGDDVIVGARRTSGSAFSGFAYIFARARGWDLDRSFGTSFNTVAGPPGASVDIDGRVAAVLWPGVDDRDPAQIAAVERLPGGFWLAQTVFTPEGTIVGPDIAVDDDAIAARIESYAFRGVGLAVRVSPSVFRFETFLEQPESDSFGAAIGISNGRLAVGAVGDAPAGRVYTYRQIAGGTWYSGQTLEVPGVGAIGSAIALEGGCLIAGAPTDDTQGTDAGAAWIADLPGPDCNANGVWDTCDILDGTSADGDGDGVPDECADTCPYDLDASGVVGFNDLLIVLNSWGSCPNCLADVSESGSVGFLELSDLLQAWGDCP